MPGELEIQAASLPLHDEGRKGPSQALPRSPNPLPRNSSASNLSRSASRYIEASVNHKVATGSSGEHGSWQQVVIDDPDRPQSAPKHRPAWGGNAKAPPHAQYDTSVPAWEQCASSARCSHLSSSASASHFDDANACMPGGAYHTTASPTVEQQLRVNHKSPTHRSPMRKSATNPRLTHPMSVLTPDSPFGDSRPAYHRPISYGDTPYVQSPSRRLKRSPSKGKSQGTPRPALTSPYPCSAYPTSACERFGFISSGNGFDPPPLAAASSPWAHSSPWEQWASPRNSPAEASLGQQLGVDRVDNNSASLAALSGKLEAGHMLEADELAELRAAAREEPREALLHSALAQSSFPASSPSLTSSSPTRMERARMERARQRKKSPSAHRGEAIGEADEEGGGSYTRSMEELTMQLEASRLAHATDKHSERSMAFQKGKLDLALAKSKDQLHAAHRRIEEQRMEIASLQGRSAALRLASEEAAIRGSPWKTEEASRYSSALAKDSATFLSEDLRVLLDEAMLASRRRVSDAIYDAGKARVESEQADINSVANLDRAIHPLEHDARMTARAILAGCMRSATRLRAAVQKLEVEARVAQSTHAADMRSLGASSQAQRESIEACLTTELRRVEEEGAFSLKALSAENEQLRRHVQARDLELQSMSLELHGFSNELGGERERAAREAQQAADTIFSLRGEVGRLSAELAEARRARSVEVACLIQEVVDDEEQEAAERAANAMRESGGEAAKRAMAKEYEDAMAELRALRKSEVEELTARLHAAGLDHSALGRESAEKFKLLTFTKDNEIEALKKRMHTLHQQLMSYRAGSSRSGRAALYDANVRKAAGTNSMGLGGVQPPQGNWDGKSGAASLGREPGVRSGRFA